MAGGRHADSAVCILRFLLLAALSVRCNSAWLRGKPTDDVNASYLGSLSGGHDSCGSKQAKCRCGIEADRQITIIDVKRCKFSTSWGSQCQPCIKARVLCQRLQNCSRCHKHNPHALCARCPLDRHGEYCQKETPCKSPQNVTEYATLHPHFNKKGVYRLEFRCTAGRVRQGPRVLKCQSDGTWNKKPPTCVLPKVCSTLRPTAIPPPRVKEMTSERVLYVCEGGNVTSGGTSDMTLHCKNGVWAQERESSLCELKGCQRLSIEEGEVVYGGHLNSKTPHVPFQTVANLTCKDGFTLQGSPQVTCSSTGQWSPSVPKCLPARYYNVHQGELCPVNNTSTVIANTNRTTVYPGQIVTYRCQQMSFRYRGVGTPERVCLYNGTLSGSEIRCEIIPACQIDTAGDPHVKFCRGSNCKETVTGEDQFKDKSYEFPPNWIPKAGHVSFWCDDREYYRLTGGPSQQQCKPPLIGHGVLRAPSCQAMCGKRRQRKNARVMGGEESGIEEWPWQAAIVLVKGREAEFICGATLIYEEWAVTAAHCVTVDRTMQATKTYEMKLTYGLSTRNESMSRAIHSQGRYDVSRIVMHPKYNNNSLDNDIALIKLKTPANMDFNVGIVCLPASLNCSDQRLAIGGEGVVTGWGVASSAGLSNKLREVTLYIADKSDCEIQYKNQGKGYNMNFTTDNMFCTRSKSVTEDATDGDSGGPFVMKGASSDWVLEGIVSWGPHDDVNKPKRRRADTHIKIASDPYPLLPTCQGEACFGVYTRVANYLPWIQQETGRPGHRRCA